MMTDPARAILITGGAVRLGAAMALAVARDGFDVAIHCRRSVAEARVLAGRIESLGRRAVVVTANLAVESETARVVAEAHEGLGPIGVLVNNASTFDLDRLDTVTRQSWDSHLETNLRAPVVLSQAFVRQLPATGSGLIVNMLDQRVLNLTPNFLSYSISRMGLWAATQVLARDLAPRVRVNAIGPGPTLPAPGMSRERFEALCRATPLQRAASPEEIAAALRFIIASPSMTGQLITLDGGQQLGWLTPGAPNVD
jgi:NAD(P)-dependent dehydrogenase (short-subunit alcohol dehydrogenase family)